MGGGLMQLVAYGAQDVYLTGNPQITFFKVVYRRHTNFSKECHEHSFQGTPDFGRRSSVTITRSGDLATQMHLRVKLPDVKAPSGYENDANTQFAWVRNPGYALMKSVEVEIGGSKIDKQYGTWSHVWGELSRSSDLDNAHSEMVGDVAALTDLSSPDSEGYCKRARVLFVPLSFWFCRNNGLALPLIAMQYHEVRVHFEFRAAAEMACVSGGFVNNVSLSLSDASLLVDYVYLDSIERRRFAQVGHEYLIEQVQYTGEESVTSATAKYKLGFNHPTTELVWVMKAGQFTSGNKFLAYSGTADWSGALTNAAANLAAGLLQMNSDGEATVTADNSGSPAEAAGYTNVQADGDAVVVDGVTCSVVGGSLADGHYRVLSADGLGGLRGRLSSITYNIAADDTLTSVVVSHSLNVRDLSRPISEWAASSDGRNAWTQANKDVTVYDHSNYGLTLDRKNNPVNEGLLMFNGHNRFDKREGSYFNHVQPNQCHTRAPADGVNVYCFALNPEQHQPSGSANLSRIDQCLLSLYFADSSASGAAADDTYTHQYANDDNTKMHIYAHSKNVLRVMSGMAGLAYAN